MAKSVKTIKIAGDADYAKVHDRLKQFREDNPRGSISTESYIDEGYIVFKTYILKDKSDEHSADATGHARGENTKEKKLFEKLETISVGRALALLGYGGDGEIASTEEMEEYYSDRDKKIEEAIEKINSAKNKKELKKIWANLGTVIKWPKVIKAKDHMKEALEMKEDKNEDN